MENLWILEAGIICETHGNPKAIAKSVRFLALGIGELTQEHGIPLVENKPLVQAVYKSVEIGQYIYRATAVILAYRYRYGDPLIR